MTGLVLAAAVGTWCKREVAVNIEVWSDVVCPWCYIGKRRLESALEQFEHRDDVTVTWRSFELDPSTPKTLDQPLDELLARKYGTTVQQARQMQKRVEDAAAEEGITMRFDIARTGNTFDAHRVIHHAREAGRDADVKERLLQAYFTQGRPISDPDTLADIAGEAGLDRDAVRAMLDTDAHADAVREEERKAHGYGAGGVPFFVIDERYGVSGAQPSETLLKVMRTVHADSAPEVADADACDDDGCAI